MDDGEIDNFVKKFKMLRGAGYDASLNLESKLGEVYISLSCKVGRVLSPSTTPTCVVTKRRSPSYYRRLARRKAARDLNLEQSIVAEKANNEVNTIAVQPGLEGAEETEAVDAEESTAMSAEYEEDEVVDDEEACQETDDELSEDLSSQLNALIEESKKQRENLEKFRDSDQNG